MVVEIQPKTHMKLFVHICKVRDPLLFSLLVSGNYPELEPTKMFEQYFYQHCTNSGLHNTSALTLRYLSFYKTLNIFLSACPKGSLIPLQQEQEFYTTGTF